MCGIIGYAGSNVNSFNKHKFNLIGVYNDSRGGDSCGVSVDGIIQKGIHLNKLYRKFISTNVIEPKHHPTVIAHTRKSSVGAITKDNAHPFEFSINEDTMDINLIGCHNGTIHNHDDLAKEFNISKTVTQTTLDTQGLLSTTYKSKTDSQIILQILAENPENYSVLEKYYGGAALLWYNPHEPNVIYVFKGSSKKYSSAVNEVEERPLFYFKESDGIYISSLDDPLFAIGGTLDSVGSFETNIVYKITNGDLDNAETTVVNRSNVSQSSFYEGDRYYNSRYYSNNYHDIDSGVDDYNYLDNAIDKGKSFNKPQFSKKNDSKGNTLFNIHDEVIKPCKKKSLIYCESLRYKRNGHLINGVYTYVKDWGYVYLGMNVSDSRKEFKNKIGKPFLNGHFIATPNLKDSFIPFIKKDYKNNKILPLYYFIEGVMMRTAIDYTHLKSNKQLITDIKNLSEASMYPVTYHKNRQPVSKQEVYYNGFVFTGTIAPLGSMFLYTIINGNTKKRKSVDVNFTKVISKKTRNPQKVKKDLLHIITSDLSKEVRTKKPKKMMTKSAEKSSNELLLMTTQNNILPMYTFIPKVIEQIKKHDGSANRRTILNSLTTVSKEFENILKLNDNVK